MKESNADQDQADWVRHYEGRFTRPELLAALVTAEAVKHEKIVSRGMAALMGAAAILLVDQADINNAEQVIAWTEDPQLIITASTAFLSGTVSAGARMKAAILENRAGETYKEIRRTTGFKQGKLSNLIEGIFVQGPKVDKEL